MRRDYDIIERLMILVGRSTEAKVRWTRRHSWSPYGEQMPDILVVADGYQGARLLKRVREHSHLSVYWPGRGESYIAGRPAARVTFLSEAARARLSEDEVMLLRSRTITWGDRALWLEV